MRASIQLAKALHWPTPRHLRSKHRETTYREQFGAFLMERYYHPASYWKTPTGQADLSAHLGRVDDFRNSYIPWLDRAARFDGLRILEVGCGTGASTVALAEQGAIVVGLDMDEPSILIAKRRCELHGVNASFILGNAENVSALVELGSFDIVIFFAALEHMTHDERLQSLSETWKGLRPGALLAVIDTPNRLWYYDAHTSYLNFFHWLPDELALRYTQFCSHAQVRELHRTSGVQELQRWGRGVSFHDFDLSIGDVRKLKVAASFRPYHRLRFPAHMAKWWLSPYRSYHRLLRRIAPDIHPAFLEPYLDLILLRQ